MSDTSSIIRNRIIDGFLDAAGWGAAERAPMVGDASVRSYQRVVMGARSAVLMDAPSQVADVQRFVMIAKHLIKLGYSAPRIYHVDEPHGLVLLEDFGDATYSRARADNLVPERQLYETAVDLLADLHSRPASDTLLSVLPAYDHRALQDKADLLLDWYLPAATGEKTSDAVRASFHDAWRVPLSWLAGHGPTLVLRDFMVDNLMWLSDRSGLTACGLLDFQDASSGSPAYDLVSLLHDVRCDLDPALVNDMRARYAAAIDPAVFGPGEFDRAFAICGAQRQTRILGVFTRLAQRDGKSRYLEFMPRTWRLLEMALQHPDLAPVARWYDEHLPHNLRRTPKW